MFVRSCLCCCCLFAFDIPIVIVNPERPLNKLQTVDILASDESNEFPPRSRPMSMFDELAVVSCACWIKWFFFCRKSKDCDLVLSPFSSFHIRSELCAYRKLSYVQNILVFLANCTRQLILLTCESRRHTITKALPQTITDEYTTRKKMDFFLFDEWKSFIQLNRTFHSFRCIFVHRIAGCGCVTIQPPIVRNLMQAKWETAKDEGKFLPHCRAVGVHHHTICHFIPDDKR